MRTFKDYSSFRPERYQACIVRDLIIEEWAIAVCAGQDKDGNYVFYDYRDLFTTRWMQFLPLNNITLLLVGTDKSYTTLVEELNDI